MLYPRRSYGALTPARLDWLPGEAIGQLRSSIGQRGIDHDGDEPVGEAGGEFARYGARANAEDQRHDKASDALEDPRPAAVGRDRHQRRY